MRKLTEEEFVEKYNIYKDLIYNISYPYFNNKMDTEDVVQDVFLKYLDTDIIFNTPDDEKYYLIRMTINICKNKITSSWKKKIIINDEVIDNTSNEKKEDNKLYYEIIINLPPKYKEVIILHYYEDLKVEEIARILKVSTSCVKKRLERAKEKIKKELENND